MLYLIRRKSDGMYYLRMNPHSTTWDSFAAYIDRRYNEIEAIREELITLHRMDPKDLEVVELQEVRRLA